MKTKTAKKKTASGDPINPAWLTIAQKNLPADIYQSVKLQATNHRVTLAELRAERERVEKLARDHALEAALEFYFPKSCESDEANLKSLKHIVFTNWLEAHAFDEKFDGLRLLS